MKKRLRVLQFLAGITLFASVCVSGHFEFMGNGYLIVFVIALCACLSFMWLTAKREGLTWKMPKIRGGGS